MARRRIDMRIIKKTISFTLALVLFMSLFTVMPVAKLTVQAAGYGAPGYTSPTPSDRSIHYVNNRLTVQLLDRGFEGTLRVDYLMLKAGAQPNPTSESEAHDGERWTMYGKGSKTHYCTTGENWAGRWLKFIAYNEGQDYGWADPRYIYIPATITFNPNGGSVSSQSGLTGIVSGIGGRLSSLPTPTRSGYSFDGWYTSSTGGTKVTTSYVFTTNSTIYARWTPDTYPYPITLSRNPTAGGTVSGAGTFNGGTSRTVTATVNNGYTFDGWYEGNTRVSTSLNYTFTLNSNRNLEARFILQPSATVPGAPQNPSATPGDRQVMLRWDAPSDNGGSTITRYEVSSNNGSTWATASSNNSHTFTGLTNGISYIFRIRAVNSVGAGTAASVTATPVGTVTTTPIYDYRYVNHSRRISVYSDLDLINKIGEWDAGRAVWVDVRYDFPDGKHVAQCGAAFGKTVTYVNANDLAESPMREIINANRYVNTQSGPLNLRAEKSTTSNVLTTIPKNTLIYVDYVETVGGIRWAYTDFNGFYGYVDSSYLSIDSPIKEATFIHPAPGYNINSPYGWRESTKSFHTGVDFPTSMNTAIIASADGKVAAVKNHGSTSYGLHIIIDHLNGYSTLYAHLNTVLVSSGQVVSQGQQIARSGNTGRSTGPHLHFEIQINGKHQNPRNYIPGLGGSDLELLNEPPMEIVEASDLFPQDLNLSIDPNKVNLTDALYMAMQMLSDGEYTTDSLMELWDEIELAMLVLADGLTTQGEMDLVTTKLNTAMNRLVKLPTSYDVQTFALANGTITPNKSSATAGETITLAIIPNNGYKLKEGSLKYNGTTIDGDSFIMPASSVLITAEFEQMTTKPVAPTWAHVGAAVTSGTNWLSNVGGWLARGGTIELTAYTDGENVTCEWHRVNWSEGGTDTRLTGTANTIIDTPNYGVYAYYVLVSNASGVIYSPIEDVMIIVPENPTIESITPISPLTAEPGKEVTITVTASGSGLSYGWFYVDWDANAVTSLGGGKENNVTINTPMKPGVYSYFAGIVSDSWGIAWSNFITIIVE